MSLLEGSWFGAKPVLFYRFARGPITWCYTSADRNQTLGEDEYTPLPIKPPQVRQGSEKGRRSFKVELPRTAAVAANWLPYSPSEVITLTVLCRHVGEIDTLVEAQGRVVGSVFKDDLLALTCEPTMTRGRRTGSPRRLTVGCDLVVYGKGPGLCNLDPDAVPVTGTLTDVAELTLTITAAEFAGAPRNLAGGMVEWTDTEEVLHQIPIVSHSGQTITLESWDAQLLVDLELTAYTAPLKFDATLTALSGLTLTAAEFTTYASGRLAGGFIEWVRADGATEIRTIREHSGDTITIDYGALDLAVDLVVTAYPGCAHTWAACGQLENQINYGGNLHMPLENPYSGDPVW
ncbi:MAG: phage BR0599 family protein [Pseudomonadaceae bacterium]